MANPIVSDHPDWFAGTDEDRALVTDLAFDKSVGQDPEFLKSSPEIQDKVRFAYEQKIQRTALNSVHNPSNIQRAANQAEADYNGLWDNVGNSLVHSHKGAIDRRQIVDDAIVPDGVVDNGFARQASKIFQKQNEAPQTADKKKLAKAVTKLQKATDRDGWFNDTAAWAEFIFKDLPQNLGGIAEVAAESSSSLTVMGMGAWGGAKIGGVVGNVIPGAGTAAGATVGAMAGMFTAEVGDAGSHKILEIIRTELESKDLALTEVNIQKLMDDKG
ncbi:MAG: glycine zipper family protein, partial [Thiotrichaceae bacterium]|nr:glycine zipper family protein [Thiotrichaceae bacterium]